MDPFRAALHARLVAATAVTSLLADGAAGVWHRHADPGAADPMVIFARRTGNDRYLFGGGELLEETWIVRGVARDAATPGATLAEDIAAALNDALHDAPLVVTGHTVLWIRRLSVVDYDEMDGQTRFSHLGGIYRIASEPA